MTALAKTSGAKGVHVVVPLAPGQSAVDVAAATRAIAARAERLDPKLTTTAFVVEERGGKVFLDATRAGGATVVAAYSPRVRPGVPVSFPLAWDDLAGASPAEFTIATVPRLLGDAILRFLASFFPKLGHCGWEKQIRRFEYPRSPGSNNLVQPSSS